MTQPGAALLEAVAVMDRLRSPGGCAWDAEQTHASLAPYAIEEAYEVAQAAEADDAEALAEELGDLLLQVLFHARVAAEAEDGFDIDDVARVLVAKLKRRHPHVFDVETRLSPDQVSRQWDDIKAGEGRDHVLDGIPVALPALARAQKVVRRLRQAERPPAPPSPADPATPAQRLGEELLMLVRRADEEGVDAEAALRMTVRRVEDQARPLADQARPLAEVVRPSRGSTAGRTTST
ncbi:MAG: MazG family protein [Beutenbergiaceae bacterium]